jgi:LPXTG-motif cell wall-anchored protein
MKLRGLARVAAVAAASFLFIGAVGAPAFAEPDGPEPIGLVLKVPDAGIKAADFATHGCNGIADGVAKPGIDGWFFNQPVTDEGIDDEDVLYFFGFLTGPDKGILLEVSSDGVHSWVLSLAAMAKLKSAIKANSLKAAADTNEPSPIPLPAGVAGKAGKGGAWLQTPAGWTLLAGALILNLPQEEPEQTAATEETEPEPDIFDLVRTCLPLPSASPTPPPLPVTGTNTWYLAGAGTVLVAFGAVLFLLRRRRESVKFVA